MMVHSSLNHDTTLSFPCPPQVQEQLDNVLTSGQNVAQMVRQILEGMGNQRRITS